MLIYQDIDNYHFPLKTQILIPFLELPDPELIEKLCSKEDIYRDALSFSIYTDAFARADIAFHQNLIVPTLAITCPTFDQDLVLRVVTAYFLDHQIEHTVQCYFISDYLWGNQTFVDGFIDRCGFENIPIELHVIPGKEKR